MMYAPHPRDALLTHVHPHILRERSCWLAIFGTHQLYDDADLGHAGLNPEDDQ